MRVNQQSPEVIHQFYAPLTNNVMYLPVNALGFWSLVWWTESSFKAVTAYSKNAPHEAYLGLCQPSMMEFFCKHNLKTVEI